MEGYGVGGRSVEHRSASINLNEGRGDDHLRIKRCPCLWQCSANMNPRLMDLNAGVLHHGRSLASCPGIVVEIRLYASPY